MSLGKVLNELLIVADSRAIRTSSRDAWVWTVRAEAYAQQGRWDEAIADYTATLRLDPGLALAYEGRSRDHAARGDPGPARSDHEAAVRLDPSLGKK